MQRTWGFDFRRNAALDKATFGQYSTEMFTREAEKIIADHNTSQVCMTVAHVDTSILKRIISYIEKNCMQSIKGCISLGVRQDIDSILHLTPAAIGQWFLRSISPSHVGRELIC